MTKTLGDYTLIKQIGQGSLGTVYLAEHRFMKRQYALKVLPEELSADRGFISRFEEEVGRLASLEHPHIVKIHNISFAQGTYFLVNDVIVDSVNETTNLAQYLAMLKGPMKENDLLILLRQLADALDYAHGRTGGEGVIAHRGLKLNNVLIGRDTHGICGYLSDFGMSKIIGIGSVLSRCYMATAAALAGADLGLQTPKGELKSEEGYLPESDATKLSLLHNTFLQNFAFLAPEQKRLQDGRPIDGRADAYAFGVLAYYLLLRELPEGIFEWPSERLVGYRLNWDTLIEQCLQADPEKRPESLLDVLDEVELPATTKPPALSKQPLPSIETPKAAVERILAKPVPAPLATSSQVQPEAARPLQKFRMVQPVDYQLQVPSTLAGPVRPAPQPVESSAGQRTAVATPMKMATPQTTPSATASSNKHLYPAHELHVTTYQPEQKTLQAVEPLPTDMVMIPAGTYWQGSTEGSRDEMPRHQIHLNSFAMATHPVTNQQFMLFLEFMEGEKDEQSHDLIILRDSRIRRSAGKLIIESGYGKHPVVGVTWYGALAYARWVGKRLPTEAEWEVAAKGGDDATYPTGERIEKHQANFFSSDTTPVMSYPPNGYGLYDMAGNVYEWCQDWYGYNYYETSSQEPDNPRGPIQGVYRVLRGGCWKSLIDDLRASHRHRNNPGTVNGTYGFRLAADV